MTDPVPRAPARRTVRMASALVAVQVALCAVIGFVTFGATHHRPGAPALGTDPLAAGPALIPPATAEPADPPPAGQAVAASTTHPTGTPSSHHRTATTPPPAGVAVPMPPSPPAAGVLMSTGAPIPSPALSEAIAPTPPPPSPGRVSTSPPAVQTGVVLQDVCSPENAPGKTVQNQPAICGRTSDGTLRWKTG